MLSKARVKERAYLSDIADLERGFEEIQHGRTPVIRSNVEYNPFSTEPEKNGMDVPSTSPMHRQGGVTLKDKRIRTLNIMFFNFNDFAV